MSASSWLATPDPLRTSMLQTTVEKITGAMSQEVQDDLAIEEPLEIQLTFGPPNSRQTRSISVTMRTPGDDFDLAAGFLMTEGVIQDANDIERISYAGHPSSETEPQAISAFRQEARVTPRIARYSASVGIPPSAPNCT